MAGISEEDIRKVREASDLIEIVGERLPLKQRGRDFWCCCPFHEEKTPSCKLDPSTQLWHCFGCGEGGDVFSYVMKSEQLDFPDAVRFLAARANIEIHESATTKVAKGEKVRLKEVCAETATFYHLQLMRSPDQGPAAARSYLADRGLGGSVPGTWKLGFAPGRGALVKHLRQKGFTAQEMVKANVAVMREGRGVADRFYNRVMFPIFDENGDCIAFGGRVIGQGEPKYLNSQETPVFHKSEVLYGLDKAKIDMASSGVAIVVEGYTDVIACHEAGIRNVVATLGTALTRQHIRKLSRHAKKKIVYLFDGDSAGQRAADRALGFIDSSMTPEAGRDRIDLMAITLPDNLDPADYIAQRGAEALSDEIEHAKPLLEYGIERRIARYDNGTPEGRSKSAAEALSVLAPIKDSLLAKDYAVFIASKLHMRENDVLDQLEKVKPARTIDSGESVRVEPAVQDTPRELPQAQRNRLRFEREFLSLCALRPALALQQAQCLAQTQWSDPLHDQTAQAILDVLAGGASVEPAELVRSVSQKVPAATKVLTGATVGNSSDTRLAKTLEFLSDELAIGDAEEMLESLREAMKSDTASDEAATRALFENAVVLQRQLNDLRRNHVRP